MLGVNIHAINYTFGVAGLSEQIDQVRQLLTAHKGPAILSGDPNTWNKRRRNVVNTLASDVGLDALSFSVDHRSTVFGSKLDHIFFRGLGVIRALTRRLNTSDHNPLLAKLKL